MTIAILRAGDMDRIAQLLKQDEFFWADLLLEDAPPAEELAKIFGLSSSAAKALVPLPAILLLIYGPRRQRRSSTTTGISRSVRS